MYVNTGMPSLDLTAVHNSKFGFLSVLFVRYTLNLEAISIANLFLVNKLIISGNTYVTHCNHKRYKAISFGRITFGCGIVVAAVVLQQQ